MEWLQEIHLGCVLWVIGIFAIVGIYLDGRTERHARKSSENRKKDDSLAA